MNKSPATQIALTREEILNHEKWEMAWLIQGADLSFIRRLCGMALAYLDLMSQEEIRKRHPPLTVIPLTDIISIKDNGQGMCTISVNNSEWKADYSMAIHTLEDMTEKLSKWEEREST